MNYMTSEDIVRAYLRATQERRLVDATAFLASDFTCEFPGGEQFTSLDELVTWSSSRYRRIEKKIDQLDVILAANGDVVYCYGTLFGEWPDGTSFSGVRFIDRFTVVDDRLTDQRVWNDLAESRTS